MAHLFQIWNTGWSKIFSLKKRGRREQEIKRVWIRITTSEVMMTGGGGRNEIESKKDGETENGEKEDDEKKEKGRVEDVTRL